MLYSYSLEVSAVNLSPNMIEHDRGNVTASIEESGDVIASNIIVCSFQGWPNVIYGMFNTRINRLNLKY